MVNKLHSFHMSNDDNDFFSGIFSMIKSITGENIITESSISLSSSKSSDDYPLTNILIDEDYWRTESTTEDNQYIQIDFKKNRVRLDNIHLFFYQSDVREQYDLYGSVSYQNKEIKLETLHSDATPSENTGKKVYDNISVTNNQYWNKIKLVAKGPRGSGDYRFAIHRLELCGSFAIFKDLIQQSYKVDVYPVKVFTNIFFLTKI